MLSRLATLLVACAALGACTTHSELTERSIFGSPFASLEIENGPVGLECPSQVIRDDKCWIDGVGYPIGRGYVYTPDGKIIRLNRIQRRMLREREEALQAKADVLESLKNGTPIPADSPALPENQRDIEPD